MSHLELNGWTRMYYLPDQSGNNQALLCPIWGWRAVDNIPGMSSLHWAMSLLVLQLFSWGQHSNMWNPLVSPPRSLLTGSADILHWFHWCRPHLRIYGKNGKLQWETPIVAVIRSTALTRWNYPTSNCYTWWSHLVSISCQISFSPNFSSFDLLCSKYWRFKKVINLWLHDDLQPHFSFVLV